MKNFKKLRNKKNWSQRYLAELTGYSLRQIQRFEDGAKMKPFIEKMFRYVLEGKI